jgi:anti-sigma-K factor RskA
VNDSRDDSTALAAAYALDALSDGERRDVEGRLARDRRLAAEVREFRETAGMLGLAPEPVAPAPDLRGRLLDAVGDLPQSHGSVTELRPRWYTRPVAAFGAAAAVVLLVLGGVTATSLLRPDAPTVVEQITAAADYERATADVAGGGTVTLVWSPSLERAAILATDLPAAPSGHSYQMWFIDEEGATSAGTFGVADGHGIPLDGILEPGDAIGITIEPTGGSPAPTSDPIVVIPTTA